MGAGEADRGAVKSALLYVRIIGERLGAAPSLQERPTHTRCLLVFYDASRLSIYSAIIYFMFMWSSLLPRYSIATGTFTNSHSLTRRR
jgi:hypothetical protein